MRLYNYHSYRSAYETRSHVKMRDKGTRKLPSWRKSNLVIREMRRESS